MIVLLGGPAICNGVVEPASSCRDSKCGLGSDFRLRIADGRLTADHDGGLTLGEFRADWLSALDDNRSVNGSEPIVEFQGGLRLVLSDGFEQPIEKGRALVLSRRLERLPPGTLAGRRAIHDLLEIPDDRRLVTQIAA